MSQKDQILNHLKTRKRGLTQLEALKNFGCMRLAVYIQRLRDSGHLIGTHLIDNPNGNGRYARYFYEGSK